MSGDCGGWLECARGADYGTIVDAIAGFEGAGEMNDVFGRGDASEKILEII